LELTEFRFTITGSIGKNAHRWSAALFVNGQRCGHSVSCDSKQEAFTALNDEIDSVRPRLEVAFDAWRWNSADKMAALSDRPLHTGE